MAQRKTYKKNRFLQNNTIITMTQILPNHEYSPLQAKPANKRSKIILYIIIAVVAGMVTGGFVPDIAVKFSLLGEIFINALMMLVIPIVILSLIVGITNLGDLRSLGTLGWRTIVYYLTTTCIAVLIGITLVNIIQPGKGLSTGEIHLDASYTIQENNSYDVNEDTMGEVFRQILIGDKESGKQGMLPHNIFAAMAQMEILPLIVFSLLIGMSLSALGPKAQSAVNVISILNDAVMKITHWVLYIAPIGIFGLISSRVGQAGGFSGFVPELWLLGKYFFTVLIGLAIHGFVILPLILKIFGKRSPVIFGKGMSAALLNAFSTASSSATLPLTMQCAEEKNKISNRTASFVLPLGATINMDGTALYEAVTAIFIAQVYGITMTPAMQIIIFVTATLAAIGAAGIPEAGLITMVIVLKSVGLPIEGIGLILAIDWLLDRFRTAVNVWGDSVGAGVIERYELKKNM
ncbi:dicarboxylate/amino acid:cation symporter [Candidatus Kuenenia sp.]|uniref:dicarboxylate/amino acid:cation symporter n=1 Tax=Candidatus Kuenenia sp. TaxID=2499824 RepID=UPI0032203FCA